MSILSLISNFSSTANHDVFSRTDSGLFGIDSVARDRMPNPRAGASDQSQHRASFFDFARPNAPGKHILGAIVFGGIGALALGLAGALAFGLPILGLAGAAAGVCIYVACYTIDGTSGR